MQVMLPAPDHSDHPDRDAPATDEPTRATPAPGPAAPLGFSGVPASTPLPQLQPVEAVSPPPAAAPAPTPTATPTPAVAATPTSAPAAPQVADDWVPRTDDFLPAAPRPASALSTLGVGTPKPGLLSRLRRRRDDAPVAAAVAPEPVSTRTPTPSLPGPAPSAPSTPDDRESYAFWSQDRAPRDFSDVMALPDLPLDGTVER